ncbi:Ankyrin repeat domain-containing protein 50 [Cladobotryum mycophilum]|uniref:Ankyrin repeat domain-containing protein 50 n=1 Tax=Cladobotryum mycophilum TaxID=491253 RepID=A0ABR0SH08_9HYPO
MSNPSDYTVGWICALSTEYVAAQAFLDEKHEGPERVSPNDNNDYTLGKIGKHNVVIAVLPDGEYGTSRAASVASDMMHSFPNIRIGLMVGIGGAAPSQKHDLRLGDIVVSAPRDGKGGVLQYDFGKTIQNQSFQRTGVLNQPPTVLRAAVNGLRAQYESDGHQFEESINNILQKKPKLRKKYSRPDPSSDRLYQSGVVHPEDDDLSCATACGTDHSKLILRSERTEEDDNPMIHYGVIASGNQLMKDALVRDKLAAEENILCFEMEAAGLMNHFPCLVIRGICDYSDSHKNKQWQGYAAMAAAAYASDLLYRIAPNRVEAEKKIGDILCGVHEVAKEHRDIVKEQLQVQKDLANRKLSEDEQKCHQLFRLTTSGKDTTYEWYKDRVEERVEDTCLWFLKHMHFQEWLKRESGPLLVTADPGCGKSVLAKYLIDRSLRKLATVCYFFFKDQDQNTARQALCAVLHQLFSQKPSLIKYAMTQFKRDGQGLVHSTNSLWEVLQNAINDPEAGPVIVVLDALDECAESELAGLMQNMQSQFRGDRLGPAKLKYLLTCRPYEQIVSKFHGLLDAFPNIRIPGEEESDTISQEVNRVITYRVNRLSEKKNLAPQTKSHLETKLLKIEHRTYLWVYLIFDYLEEEHFKKTPNGIESAIATLPSSINQAYEQILNKSKKDGMVRKALSIILAASRPLKLSEMNIALNIEYTSKSFQDLDLEDDEDFKSRLRSLCGLFVSVHQNCIYFLHQTAREFLLADLVSSTAIRSELRWYHSISTHHAHTVLAEVCVLYLKFLNSDVALSTNTNDQSGDSLDNHGLLDYSAKNWGAHFRKADISDSTSIISLFVRICAPDPKSYSAWFRIYRKTGGIQNIEYFTDLTVASYYGHHSVTKLLVEKGADVEAKDSEYGKTPLSWAAENGYEAVVKLLIENGADVESKDSKYSQTPLSWAARRGHEAIIKLLIEKGADVEAKDSEYGQTPLSWAAENGYEAVVKLLIENGADVESKDSKYGADVEAKDSEYSQTPLSWAARRGHEAIIKLLIEKGADVEAKDSEYGQTPLSWAAENGYEAVVKLLIENGADVESKDSKYGADVEAKDSEYSQTPLSWAARRGHEAIIKLLIEKGADVEAKDSEYGQTPLSWAAENGYEAVVKLLIENGADVESKDSEYGKTPLSWAAENGYEAVVKLLIENGADVESKDSEYGKTPLSWAAENGYEAVVKLLIENGADVESKDSEYGKTPLSWAAENGYEAVVKLLIENGADVESKGSKYGKTPLSWAAENGYEAVVKLLIENGADVESKDSEYGKTPLSWAAKNGHKAVVKLLIENGADVEAKDSEYGKTPLSWAAKNGHKAVVKLLIENGADVEAKDNYGQTPLSWAAKNGHKAVVKLL